MYSHCRFCIISLQRIHHTKNNVSLSLVNRIVSLVTNNRENRVKELKEHLLDRKNSQYIIDYSFTKLFQPKFQTENNDSITFIRTYNPNHNINFKNSIAAQIKLKTKTLKFAFKKKSIIIH